MKNGLLARIQARLPEPLRRRTADRHRRRPPSTLNDIHDYWRAPPGDGNLPDDYLRVSPRRSELLVRLIRDTVSTPEPSVLELGCNVGRNLECLRREAVAGSLAGIEISDAAVRAMREHYPELAQTARILNCAAEQALPTLDDGAYDVVFTMAVLEHIHPSSEWIFGELARVSARWLITIEDERSLSLRHFARNYRTVFEPLGLSQVQEIDSLKTWVADGAPQLVARVFEKR